MRIFLQRLVPIQPKTSNISPTFCRSAVVSPRRAHVEQVGERVLVLAVGHLAIFVKLHHAPKYEQVSVCNLPSRRDNSSTCALSGIARRWFLKRYSAAFCARRKPCTASSKLPSDKFWTAFKYLGWHTGFDIYKEHLTNGNE